LFLSQVLHSRYLQSLHVSTIGVAQLSVVHA
jgi:hypothetical protein